MGETFDIQSYMTKGVERVVSDKGCKAVIFVEFNSHGVLSRPIRTSM